MAALADAWRDDVVDDARIELVAGNADAGMADRGGQAAGMRLEADQANSRWCRRRNRNKNGGIGLEVLGEIEGGGHRFVDIVDFWKAEPHQCIVVARHRQFFVRAGAGKTHRAADDEAGDIAAPFRSGIRFQPLQEHPSGLRSCSAWRRPVCPGTGRWRQRS